MADEKLTDLTALDAFASGDLLYTVDDPVGTPVSKKATIDQVQDYIEGAANTFTAKQTIDLAGEQLALGGTNTGVMSFAGTTSGKVTLQAADAAGTYTLTLPTNDGDSGQFLKTDGSGVLSWDAAGGGGTPGGSDTQVQFNDGGAFGGDADLTWDKTANLLTLGADASVRRRAAANLQLGAADAAAPVAQTLSVQSVAAGTSNTAGANLTIAGSQGTGTGAGGSIVFQIAPAGTTGTAQNALVNALTIAADGTISTANFQGVTSIRPGQLFLTSSANFPKLVGPNFSFSNAANPSTAYFYSQPQFIQIAAANGTLQTELHSEADNTFAQRRTTNAQTFRVYNTFTSATNFERANIAWASNVLQIGTEKGSAGGTARALELQTDGVTRLTLAANGLTFTHSATGNVVSNTTGTNGAFIYARSTVGGTVNNVLGAASGVGFVGPESAHAFQIRSSNVTRLALDTVGSVQIATALTVATLPSSPLVGMMARVTDADSPTVGSTVVGSGAAAALVWYNGANWTVIGV
jgi:hypothetical protein